MRISDFLLSESSINTARIGLRARRAINDFMQIQANTLIEAFEGASDPYAAIFKHVIHSDEQAKDKLIRSMSSEIGSILTGLVAEEIQKTIPASRWHSPEIGSFAPTGFVVVMDAVDDDRHTRGYWNSSNRTIVLNPKQYDMLYCLMGFVQQYFEHTRPDTSFVDGVVATFVHEYTHLVQSIRSKRNGIGDFGYISTGVQDRGRKGKRGGLLRSPEVSNTDHIRYRGNVHEIDAFSSSAAYQVMATIDYDDPQRIRGALRDIRQSLLDSTYSPSEDVNDYSKLVKDAFDGVYGNKIKPKEVERVWKKFSKLVYTKIEHYIKEHPDTNAGVPKAWVHATQQESRTDAMQTIAYDVAYPIEVGIRNGLDERSTTLERITNGYGSEDQGLAEFFLRQTYNDGDYSAGDDLIRIFRKMVIKIVSRYLA